MKRNICLSSLIFIFLDFLSKRIILNLNESSIKVINNFFYIERAANDGAAFSILSGGRVIFIIIGVIVLYYIYKYILDEVKTFLEAFSFSMLIGGIIGNLIDRIVYGKVIDFLSFRFGSYNFPIFNLADTFITIGVFLLIIVYIRGEKYENRSN